MRQAVIFGVVTLTTLAAILYGHRSSRLSGHSFREAARTMLEYVGLSLVFLVLNLSLGTAGILIVREVTDRFVSIYVMNDAVLVLLSFLQGLLFGALLLPRRLRD